MVEEYFQDFETHAQRLHGHAQAQTDRNDCIYACPRQSLSQRLYAQAQAKSHVQNIVELEIKTRVHEDGSARNIVQTASVKD